MAGAPRLKVYGPSGEYVASCKYAEDAAAVVAAHGTGSTIRLGHRKADVAYTDGIDGDAGDSYDAVAEVVHKRMGERD
jgi:hypothetical protein